MNFKKVKYFILFLVITQGSFAQDLEKIGKKDMLTVNGGLNFSSVFYNAKGMQNRREPFNYFLNGNITANFIGITLPFTFNYSNNQLSHTQPYNIQSFNPTYKWIKGYAGITSLNFSQYTQASHIFTGGGVELTPKNFKFAALYGRFKKASEFDFENNSDINMAYKRMGWGGYAGYEKNGHGIKLIYFGARDNVNSLSFVPLNTNITPMENAVISAVGKTTFYKKIVLDVEYALSGLTRSLNSPIDDATAPKNRLPVIYKTNATTQFFSAYKGSLSYRHQWFGIAFNYERVDPEYKTLGAYFFNNDLENFTLAPNFTLLKNKLNVSANTGLQRNNLNNNKLNTTKRWVGSINASYAPNAKWSFGGNYSNFSSYTKQRPQEDPFYRNTLDTLNFYQLSQNATATVGYNFGKTKYKHNLTTMANYLVTGQKQGAIANPGAFGIVSDIVLPNTVLNTSIGHNVQFTKTKTSLMSNVNYNQNKFMNNTQVFFGPSLNLSQVFYKNLLRVTVGSTYNHVLLNSQANSRVLNHRLSASYSPKAKNDKLGKFSLTLSSTYIQKLKINPTAKSFTEFTGNFALAYSF